ncbi:MAG: hypothetical protein Q7T03_03395 [Deltaproteobacteria bacterium]|nr:hypothetical protein [Deltaproteobacteria bacterium]
MLSGGLDIKKVAQEACGQFRSAPSDCEGIIEAEYHNACDTAQDDNQDACFDEFVAIGAKIVSVCKNKVSSTASEHCIDTKTFKVGSTSGVFGDHLAQLRVKMETPADDASEEAPDNFATVMEHVKGNKKATKVLESLEAICGGDDVDQEVCIEYLNDAMGQLLDKSKGDAKLMADALTFSTGNKRIKYVFEGADEKIVSLKTVSQLKKYLKTAAPKEEGAEESEEADEADSKKKSKVGTRDGWVPALAFGTSFAPGSTSNAVIPVRNGSGGTTPVTNPRCTKDWPCAEGESVNSGSPSTTDSIQTTGTEFNLPRLELEFGMRRYYSLEDKKNPEYSWFAGGAVAYTFLNGQSSNPNVTDQSANDSDSNVHNIALKAVAGRIWTDLELAISPTLDISIPGSNIDYGDAVGFAEYTMYGVGMEGRIARTLHHFENSKWEVRAVLVPGFRYYPEFMNRFDHQGTTYTNKGINEGFIKGMLEFVLMPSNE